MLKSPYNYWQRIYGRKLYDTEQLQVADQVVEQIERFYPGLRGAVEVVDVATPLSFERYTGNWQGATCGFLLTKQTMRMMLLGVDKTVPNLDNFYMAGQWVEPGGSVPTAAMSGRQVLQLICHADNRPFEAVTP
jgi:phytoene dehydrogenase-like protein